MKMSIQELLVQAMNLANRLSGVFSVNVSNAGSNTIDIIFKNSKGKDYAVCYDVELNGHLYNKTICFISNLTDHERFTERDYTQESLKKMLEWVNK